MSRSSLEEGYKFWHQEVLELTRSERMAVDPPVIALVGLYAVLATDPEQMTSFHWRRSVLASPEAIDGFRKSLESSHKDEVDLTYDVPLDILKPDETAMGSQMHFAYDSVMHGLPKTISTLPQNEVFLATALGLAHYNQGVNFHPLGLSDQGEYALQSNYPQTAEFVESHKS